MEWIWDGDWSISKLQAVPAARQAWDKSNFSWQSFTWWDVLGDSLKVGGVKTNQLQSSGTFWGRLGHPTVDGVL